MGQWECPFLLAACMTVSHHPGIFLGPREEGLVLPPPTPSQAVLAGAEEWKVLKPLGTEQVLGAGALPISCQEAQARGSDFVIKDVSSRS